MKIKDRVSIITVCYNSEKTIKDTLVSVLQQSYKNIEYLIIDGNSIDKTLEICYSYYDEFIKKNIDYRIVSENDSGLYDAMNKGIQLSTGEVIGILNSDDIFSDPNVIDDVVKKFNSDFSVNCVYGDVLFKDSQLNKTQRVWRAKTGNMKFGWNPPHPSTFYTKSIYTELGYYRTDMIISSDYDFMLRAIYLFNIKTVYLPRVLVYMRNGGESTRSIKSNFISMKEIYKILRENKVKYPLVIVILRLVRKMSQLLVSRKI